MQLNNIQMLRAVAALLVVFHHTLPHYEAMGGDITIIKALSSWGFLGVDIFFVISGFIMAYTTMHKSRTLENALVFIKHRFFRIYLGYWPFYFAMLLGLYAANSPRLPKIDFIGSFFLTNADMFQLVLPVSWSLSYELYFYFLFFFTFFIPRERLLSLIPILTFVLFLTVVSGYIYGKQPHSFFYSPFLLEFFGGTLLFIYRKTLINIRILPLAVIFAVVAYSYGITHEYKNALPRILTFGTGALFTVLSVLIMEEQHIYRAKGLIVDIGNASYTLYLSHLIIIYLFYAVGLRNFFQSPGTLFPLLGFIAIVILCIAFSLFYYRKIEKPIYQKAIH